MPYINWSDNFSVRVKEIDDQHKGLIESLNALHLALRANKGREAQKQIIAAMVKYAAVHFATEEKYMEQFKYPGYRKHKLEHDRFTEKAFDLKDRFEKTGMVLTLEILNFLRDWLQNHILAADKDYSQHFTKHGLS